MSIVEDYADTDTQEQLETLELNQADLKDQLILAQENIELEVRAVQEKLELYHDLKTRKTDPTEIKIRIAALESAIFDETVDPESIRIMAMENILTEAFKGIGRVLSRIHSGTMNFVDYLQYSVKLFTLQGSKIRSLRSRLTSAHQNSALIKVGVNKYLCCGQHEQPVADFKEYVAEYKKMAKVLTSFTRTIAAITEEDLFSSLSWYKEAIFGDLEDFFSDRFESLERNIFALEREIKEHQLKSTATYTEYGSGVLLGCAFVRVRAPKPNSYKRNDFDSIFGAHRYFWMGVQRVLKVRLTTLVDGRIQMDVTKREMSELLELSEKLLGEAEKLMKFSNRLSTLVAGLESDEFSKRDAEEGFDPRGLYKSMKIYTRISSMIFDSVPTAFTLALGNIKQCNSIAEKAIKEINR